MDPAFGTEQYLRARFGDDAPRSTTVGVVPPAFWLGNGSSPKSDRRVIELLRRSLSLSTSASGQFIWWDYDKPTPCPIFKHATSWTLPSLTHYHIYRSSFILSLRLIFNTTPLSLSSPLLIQSFIRHEGIPVDTARRIYRRYLKFEPGHTEEYVEFLKSRGRWDEVADNLANIVNDDSFQSLAGKSKHNLWLELCDVITAHPAEVSGLAVDVILRDGIRKFTDEVGRLWTSLADFYIRRGLFEKARDIYEEGLATVITVRDFSLIFDAYTQFGESMLSAKMEKIEVDKQCSTAEEEDGNQFLFKDVGDDIDLRLARLEHLMNRRPELLSSVMLRQNPHNVHEWQKRVALFEGSPARQIFTFTEAVKTVDPARALGNPHILWIEFAKFYEVYGDTENARVVFEKAVLVPYSKVDDLATVW